MREKDLTYDEVALVPQFGTAVTRSMCSPLTYMCGSKSAFKVPVMPANMKCSIDLPTARALQHNDYFYAMHRFGDTYEFVKLANTESWKTISISIGVKKEDRELLRQISKDSLRVDYITIDIAHGHSHSMLEMIWFVKNLFPKVFIIAGNVATPDGFTDLSKAGAHAVKVGIGQGAACTTKLQTGFTMPMFTCIQKIREERSYHSKENKSIIIADGGIKYNGDIAKAIVAGADWVMSGRLFAECKDSPAEIDSEGNKLYFGSASEANKKHTNHVEGKTLHISKSNLDYLGKLKEIEQNLQSSISYAGGATLQDLARADWITVTP